MTQRVLVLSASVGAGHLRAAEAVELALRRAVPDLEVQNHDVLNFTNAVFRRLYGRAYLDLVNRAPHVVGYFYDRLDQPSRSGKYRTDKLRFAVEKLNLRKFQEFLTSQRWDLIINTHFLPPELIALLRREGSLQVPQVTVCTDFDTHRLWVNQPCDRYFCATPEGACYLHYWGVPEDQIEVTGIPIDPLFAEPPDLPALRRKHQLPGDRPVLLQMCGGFGVGPVEEIFRGVLEVPQPIDLVVVCGRNAELRERLAQIAPPERHRVHLVGFTREMHELMACADLLVSKPGGLTTSEALARGLPMVVVNPIPGQESRNSDYLLENDAAIKINHPALARLKLSALLANPARLARMRQAAQSLGHPDSARAVVASSLRLMGRPSDA